jgi:hypothetical protein
VVTGSACVLWLELELVESSLLWVEPELLESSLLCVEAELEPSSLWLDVPVEEDELAGAVVLVAAPLPRAATASQAATNVASVTAAMRRRTVRRRCLMGASGCCMQRIVAAFAQILLGDWYGAGKNRPVPGQGASKVT